MLGERAVLRDPTAASDVYAESQKKLNKEIEQGINSNKNHKNAVDANDKSQRRLTKTGKGLGKQQSFINSGFGKFSIIMSGIAATLFVWQVLSRAIRTIVGVGIDFETAFIRAADSLKLTTAELKNLESAAIDAGKTGVIKGPDYTELISQFVEFGYSIEDATARVNAAIEHEVELFEDTITGRLKRMGGLFTEIARQAFGASGYFGDTLEDANTQLEKIADAEGSLSTIGRIIEGLGRAILEYHDKLNPILNLWRAEFDLVYRQSGILDTAASAWKRLTEATKEFYVVTPSGNVFPQRSVPEIPTVPEAQQAVAEDFDTGYGDYYPSLGADVDAAANASAELDKNTKSTAENIKETQEAAKQLSKDLKTAAGFFGFMTKKIKETRLEEIEKTITNLSKLPEFEARPELLKELRQALTVKLKFEEDAPAIGVYKSAFDKLGIIDDRYYKSRADKRDQAYVEDLIKLREHNLRIGKSIKDLPVPDFKVAGAALPDAQTLISKYTKQYGIEEYEPQIKAIVQQESQFDPYAVGKLITDKESPHFGDRAYGVGQIMQKTADRLEIDRYDPEQNVEGTVRLFKEALDRWAEKVELKINFAIADHYTGAENIRRAGGQIPDIKPDGGPSVKDYVTQVLAQTRKEIIAQWRFDTQAGGTRRPGVGATPQVYQREAFRFETERPGGGFRLGEAFEVDPKFKRDREEFIAYQKALAPAVAILKKNLDTSAGYTKEYFDNERDKLVEAQISQQTALQSIGIGEIEAKKLTERELRRKDYLLTIDEIFAKERAISKDHATALTKIFEETGFYDPALEKRHDLEQVVKQKRVLSSFGIDPKIDPEDIISGQIPAGENVVKVLKFNEALFELKKFDMKRKQDLDGWEAYYNTLKIMGAEHVKSEKDRIKLESEAMKESQIFEDDEIAKITAEKIRVLDEK
ncbi:MAG: transglycosylase SLT domain-containing protein, partial [Planctomycetota bacterium]